mgnify:CR=1 FL=1
MNKWLDKNYIDLANTFERDYEVGVELCKKNNVSALEWYEKLDGNKYFSNSFLKLRLNDAYYFLTLDRDIRGE